MAAKARPIRFSEPLLMDINQSIISQGQEGYGAFSKWVREACKDRLLRESGINEKVLDELIAIRRNFDGIGININQLARKANAGENVALSDELVVVLLNNINSFKSDSLKTVLALGK